MKDEQPARERFVILADETAEWKIAGLRQLDRLVLTLKEAGTSPPEIFWRPGIPATAKWLPNESIDCGEIPPVGARVLATRLFIRRKALPAFLHATAPVLLTSDPAAAWEAFEQACAANTSARRWAYLSRPEDARHTEAAFLRDTGKPQDGLVSRCINRPLTRPITRLLLRLPITPTAWTLSIFVLPLITCALLLRGEYASVVLGVVIYQLYSMLDGCDGEIARAKFLETARGGRVDDLCDIVGALLFVSGLGLGLSRAHGSWFYAAEGISLAAFIAVNEWALRVPSAPAAKTPSATEEAAYPRHRAMLQRVSASPVGARLMWLVLQATKRDVGILLFLLLAILGHAEWILHPWLLVTVGTLTLHALSRRGARA